MRSHSAIRFLTAEGILRAPVDAGRIQPFRYPNKDMQVRLPRAPYRKPADAGEALEAVERVVSKWESQS
jgi:hypothetical protein